MGAARVKNLGVPKLITLGQIGLILIKLVGYKYMPQIFWFCQTRGTTVPLFLFSIWWWCIYSFTIKH